MNPHMSAGVARIQAALARWFTDDTRQGFFATDAQFRVIVWNRWMEIHSGYAAADVMNASLFDLYEDAVDRGVREYYESALSGRVTVISHGLHGYLLPLPATHGDLMVDHMPQSGHVGPLSDGATVIGTVTILEDVSDRLASEAQLRKQIDAQQRARATAETALRAKDEFLSTLSHEMRTPLNAVLGWARILLAREEIDRTVLDRALQVIERNAAAQAKMIDDMLDMARIVAGKLRVEMQPVDLLGIVLAAIDVVRPSANAKQITVRTSFDPSTPRVLGDQDRLQQVTWNLLANAVKFTEPGGAIDVRLAVAGNVARIVVSDSGQGISPDFLPYVFERFRQNDSSSARRHGGLGLGLALVRELVELHGGTVAAASDGPGKGTTFTIELPIMSPEIRLSHRQESSAEAGHISLDGIRVLLVDDEADARELAMNALQHCGAEVTAVASTSEALAVIAACSPETLPDVLVSDIGMPREDGLEFIRRVRALTPEGGGGIPAVTVTGYATPQDIKRASAAGYHVHVAKPIDPAELVAAVASLAPRSPEAPVSGKR